MLASCRIIKPAGESDDRRCFPRKRNTREESPDSHSPQLARVSDYRATRLVTPGGCREGSSKLPLAVSRDLATATESATENQTAGDACTSAAGLRETTALPVSAQRIWQG